MSLFKQQRDHVRLSIQDTTVRLFKEKGYENVTIDEITKSVGIAKGTFYNFFSSKLDILMAWAEQEFRKFDFTEAMNANKTMNENLDRLIEILDKAIQQEEMLFRSFLFEIIGVFDDRRFDFISIFSGVIRSSNDFNKIGTQLIDEKINMLNSTLYLGIIHWFRQGNTSQGLKEHLQKLKEICLYGIMTNFEEVGK
ncbi:MAG: TetR/AcrR family transcriptional regulator [Clostridia bacterium]|nr:TetR/AcrR family transcriptional regulator [Clostridia bacterium]